MRAVLQRVSRASVRVEGRVVGEIGPGWLVLLGVAPLDTKDDLEYLVDKTVNLRAFGDDAGKMNLSVVDTRGAVLVISQFTLFGDCRKGRRPGFTDAAPPAMADDLYQRYVARLRDSGLKVETGVFGAHMDVELVNDGPVTLLLDSTKLL
jgi:D-aminoacyl-tRNA deacylase